MSKSDLITVGYWSTKGLGSVSRMVVLYSGNSLKAKNYKLKYVVKNNLINYDGSEWHDNAKIKLKKTNSLINLPYIELIDSSGDNLVITQSNACLSYLGRKFDMFGRNKIEESQCEQLLFETNDLRSVITSFAYTHHKNKELENNAAKEVYEKAFQNNNFGKIQKFENWLSLNKNNNNYFLLKYGITIPDFNLFDILDFYIEFLKYYNFVNEKNNNKILSETGYPYLNNFYNHFINLPKMKKYLNSIFYKLPYTNKSANFGSGIKGNKWDNNIQKDTTPSEIIIL